MEANSHPNFPRGIEVTAACIVRDAEGRILLVSSVKQKWKWTLPGGHVEPGERIMEAAVREVREETGLGTRPVEIFRFDESVNPPDFHRPIHLVYFDCLLEAEPGEVVLQEDELSAYEWVAPEKALTMDLAKGYENDLNGYIAYLASVR